MEKTKTGEVLYNGNPWNCPYCDKQLLGRFISNDKVIIQGVKGNEYEIGFTDIEVVCPQCGKTNSIPSHSLRNIRAYLEDLQGHKNEEVKMFAKEFAGRIDQMVPLEQLGLKSFYFLDSQRSKKLKGGLLEIQKRIYDYLRLYEGASDNKETRPGVIKRIAGALQLPEGVVKQNIAKIDEEIMKIKPGWASFDKPPSSG
jgi:hypothetical protein